MVHTALIKLTTMVWKCLQKPISVKLLNWSQKSGCGYFYRSEGNWTCYRCTEGHYFDLTFNREWCEAGSRLELCSLVLLAERMQSCNIISQLKLAIIDCSYSCELVNLLAFYDLSPRGYSFKSSLTLMEFDECLHYFQTMSIHGKL